MKSKQEVIQEAYDNTFPDSGNYSFDKIRSAVDENGWYRFNNNLTVNICTTGFDHDKGAYRPKSLRGIENNRGWTTIESEEDLPKEDGKYKAVLKQDEFTWVHDNFWTPDEFGPGSRDKWLALYSHWKPLEEEKAPLY